MNTGMWQLYSTPKLQLGSQQFCNLRIENQSDNTHELIQISLFVQKKLQNYATSAEAVEDSLWVKTNESVKRFSGEKCILKDKAAFCVKGTGSGGTFKPNC